MLRSTSSMDDAISGHVRTKRRNVGVLKSVNDGYNGVLNAITKKRIELAERKKSEINVLCNGALVRRDFTVDRLKFVEANSTLVNVELEDLIEGNEDQDLFHDAHRVLTCDKRGWKSFRFVDRFLLLDSSHTERFARYLMLKEALWRRIEKDVFKRKIPLFFQAVVDVHQGTTLEDLILLLQLVQQARQLQSIEFEGSLFRITPWDIPKEILDLCWDGTLKTNIAFKIHFQEEKDSNKKKKKKKKKKEDKREEEEVDETGTTRSVRVLAACVVRLQGLEEQRKNKQQQEHNKDGASARIDPSQISSMPNLPDMMDPGESNNSSLPQRRSASTNDMDASLGSSTLGISLGSSNGGGGAGGRRANQRWNAAMPTVNQISSRKKMQAMRKGIQKSIEQGFQEALWEKETHDIDTTDGEITHIAPQQGSRVPRHKRIARTKSMENYNAHNNTTRRGGRRPIKRTQSMDNSFSAMLHTNLSNSRWQKEEDNGSHNIRRAGTRPLRRTNTMDSADASGRRRPMKRSNTMDPNDLGRAKGPFRRTNTMDPNDSGGGRKRMPIRRMHTADDTTGARPLRGGKKSDFRRTNTMESAADPPRMPIRQSSTAGADEPAPPIGIQRNEKLSTTLDDDAITQWRSMTPPPNPRRGMVNSNAGPLTPPRNAASQMRMAKRLDQAFGMGTTRIDDSFAAAGGKRTPRLKRSNTMESPALASFPAELDGILPTVRSSVGGSKVAKEAADCIQELVDHKDEKLADTTKGDGDIIEDTANDSSGENRGEEGGSVDTQELEGTKTNKKKNEGKGGTTFDDERLAMSPKSGDAKAKKKRRGSALDFFAKYIQEPKGEEPKSVDSTEPDETKAKNKMTWEIQEQLFDKEKTTSDSTKGNLTRLNNKAKGEALEAMDCTQELAVDEGESSNSVEAANNTIPKNNNEVVEEYREAKPKKQKKKEKTGNVKKGEGEQVANGQSKEVKSKILDLKKKAVELQGAGDKLGAKVMLAKARDLEFSGVTVADLDDPKRLKQYAVFKKKQGDLKTAKKALKKTEMLESMKKAVELQAAGDKEGAKETLAKARELEFSGVSVADLDDPKRLKLFAVVKKKQGDLKKAKKALRKAQKLETRQENATINGV